jgi:predicted acetyltransferase
MRFDGNDVKMSGIGGVATFPEARSGGKVRRIFESLLAGAYADGVIFSCLSPFSHAFYRKFGYELCCVRREMRIPITELEKIKYSGSHEMILPGGDTAELQKIHSRYISDINFAIRRDIWPDNVAWKYFTNRDPYKNGSFIYLWRNDGGEPRGYIKYQHKHVNGDNEIEVSELVYLDKEALYAQLALAGKLSAAIKDFVWSAPMFIDPTDFVEVAWDVKQRLVPKDMARVVNVKTALELMRRPEGEGSYVVETEDSIIPENGGRWLVEFGPSGSCVTKTGKDADLVCDLPVLAQLITGYRTLGDITATTRRRLDIRGNENTLRKAFTQRPQHVTEYF